MRIVSAQKGKDEKREILKFYRGERGKLTVEEQTLVTKLKLLRGTRKIPRV